MCFRFRDTESSVLYKYSTPPETPCHAKRPSHICVNMTGVQVRVLFFGLLRDVAGKAEDTLEVSPGATLETVFDHYCQAWPQLKGLRRSIVFARNQAFADPSAQLTEGDEVAFLPPVSGGAVSSTSDGNKAAAGSCMPYIAEVRHPAGHFFALTGAEIDTKRLLKGLLRPQDGAFVEFQGVVRDNTRGRATRYLDYHCYQAMAIKVLTELGLDIASKHAIGRIAIVHRLGEMQIGETSVAIIVTSPHRGAAFDAAEECIDRLKKTVPIWKKEYFADGEVWVEGQWDDSLPRG
jgi:MoaE-MoaD fusion protein